MEELLNKLFNDSIIEDINKEAIKNALSLGLRRIIVGTSACENPSWVGELIKQFGPEKIVIGIDARDGLVATKGWVEISKTSALEFAKEMEKKGAGELLVTSMDKDGTKSGFDNNLYMELSNNLSIPVIASGGAGELSHLVDAVKLGKADALLAASIFHYEEISIKKVKHALRDEGFEVRL